MIKLVFIYFWKVYFDVINFQKAATTTVNLIKI